MTRLLPLAVVLAGCLATDLTPCADGRSCPNGTVCDDTHVTCIDQGQLDACAGVADGSACTADALTGACTDGVCFAVACGNGIVQPGEECDDGNFVDGDGCTASCLNENCGNGRLDTIRGEACDDGNLLSGDGCDSKCQVEQLSTQLRQCGEPAYIAESDTAFDAARRVVVTVLYNLVMEWDGASWTCGPPPPVDMFGDVVGFTNVVYDSSRQVEVAFSYGNQVWEWNGTAWAVRTGDALPNTQRIVFDSQIDRAVTYGSTQVVWYWNPADATWSSVTPIGAAPPANYTYTLAFDQTAEVLIMLVNDNANTTDTWVWNRTAATWTDTGQILPVRRFISMAYDAKRGKVVAFGGEDIDYSALGTLYEWTGTTWNAISTAPFARSQTAVMFDPTTKELVVAGGGDNTTSYSDVWRWDETTWTDAAQTGLIPNDTAAVAMYPPGGTVVALTSSGVTWTWDGAAWHQHPAAAIPTGDQVLLTYDTDRKHVVAYDSSGWFGEFDGQSWQLDSKDTSPIAMDSIMYDPDGARLLAGGVDGKTYVRIAAGWQDLGAVGYSGQLSAYDRRAHRMIAMGDSIQGTDVYELDPATATVASTWNVVFVFGMNMLGGTNYRAVEYPPRGAVFYIDAYGAPTWERVGSLWSVTSRADVTVTFAVADPVRGEILLISIPGRQVYGYGYTSGAPRETCVDGVDADGDGLAGCADPDCWWKCAPECPPYSSCALGTP